MTRPWRRSLPSQYLYSVVDNIPSDRPIIFYDQIGCGRSSEPTDVGLYGIPQSIDDLEKLLDELNIGAFHLLGHSYGGALAYEYAKRVSERRPSTSTLLSSPHCLSVIIANTSTSMQKGNEEWDRLFSECASDISLPGATPHDKFFRRNQCRLDTIPKDLSSAFDHCGNVWVGTDVVSDWVAVPPNPTIMMGHGDSEEGEHFQETFPPFLVVTGEYDFITQSCTLGWKDILCEALVDEKMMESCSHYVHFEQPELFGNIVEEFVLRYDQ